MKISTILDHIDSGRMVLPEFQRGYVRNRDQVRGLFESLYRRHPIGGLLEWATESSSATHRGNSQLAAGVVKLLLDCQQLITSLYGVVRGKPPRFFDGNTKAFTSLRFHRDDETFAFYPPVKMQDDPLWIDITDRLPEEYVPAIEAQHPGALASQWIPTDPNLWRVDRFRKFLEECKKLLAAEIKRRLEALVKGIRPG